MKTYIQYIFLICLFLCAACTESEPEVVASNAAEEEVDERPDQESWGSTISITRDGKQMAIVWAGHILVYNKKNETVLEDSVHIDFYDREGFHNSVLTSEEGVVNNLNRNLVATGNVVVLSDSGIVLETEKLQWDNESQKIVSEVEVKFTTRTDTLYGDSFISDPDLSNYEITNARGYSRRVLPLEKK